MATRLFKTALFLLLALVLAVPVQAKKKPKYEIILKINKCPDTMMMMGYYYAKGNHVMDTAFLDKKGRFVFSSDTDTIPNGLCFFANSHGKYVEFVMYHEKPFFEFETDNKDWTSNMKVKGSTQNQLFYDFHRAEGAISGELTRQEMLMDSVAFKEYCRQELTRLDSIKMHYITHYPDLLLSKMMVATKEIEVPLVDANGDSLSNIQRRDYYLEHYFDNIALGDNAMFHTPKAVFHDRVIGYFDNVLKYASPKVIIQYMDPVLDKTKSARETFQYLVVTLTQKYLQSKVMVYDEVYVHLVQKYYVSEDNWWSSPSTMDKEGIRAAKWERLLVGREAPELILFDTLRVPHSLHSLPHKWKLLVFWSPNCSHCQHIIPEVYRVFEKLQDEYDLGAFTILSDPDDKTRKEWKAFMQKNNMTHPAWLSLDGGEANCDWHDVYDIQTTPQIYLIDENNIIQAKKLGESSIENVLNAVCGNK